MNTIIRRLRPPEGYTTWLDYAVATMSTRDMYLKSLLEADDPKSHWAREVTRLEMFDAARAELKALRDQANDEREP